MLYALPILFYYFVRALRGSIREEDSQVCGQSSFLPLWSAGSLALRRIGIYKKIREVKKQDKREVRK